MLRVCDDKNCRLLIGFLLTKKISQIKSFQFQLKAIFFFYFFFHIQDKSPTLA